MWKSIIKSVPRSQRGFTLIELLVVMAVIGVLAGIVTTSVSGTDDTSTVAKARSDAGTVESAAGSFFTDQASTVVVSPKSVTVTAAIASAINLETGEVTYDAGATEAAVTQLTSTKWPEVFLTENSDTTTSACVNSVYCDEFPTTGLNSDGVVISVIVADSKGAAIGRSTLLGTYTAVDFAKLSSLGFIATKPDSAGQTAEVNVGSVMINVHNFLWLFRKSTSAGGGGENDARGVAVFKLANVKVTEAEVPGGDSRVTLSYAQIF